MSDLISIIVPVYNEAATISDVIERLLSIPLPAAREIIVVNDGSRDRTRAVLESLRGTSSVLTIIHAERNSGKGSAVRLGFRRSKGTIVAIQDADLELNPAQIADLVDPILQGAADVVYGSRFLNRSGEAVPLMTRVANRALTAATNLLYGSALTDMETCYKVMRGEIARGLPLEADRFDIEPEITARLLRAGYTIVERPVVFMPRSRSAGKKIRWRDGVQALVRLIRCRMSHVDPGHPRSTIERAAPSGAEREQR